MAKSNQAEDGQDGQDSQDDLIWRIGVCDAHCHPTDIMASVNNIAHMRAQALTIMATRSQDQHLVAEAADKFPLIDPAHMFITTGPANKYVIPSFGWHPWFSHQIMIEDLGGNHDNMHEVQLHHYKNVLTPKCDNHDDNNFIKALPKPISLSQYLKDTEDRLRRFPYALVGEVGLDRSFRLPTTTAIIDDEGHKDHHDSEPKEKEKEKEEKEEKEKEEEKEKKKEKEKEENKGEYTPGTRQGRPLSNYRVSLQHQKAVLKAQLQLAGKLRRPVSVHSVQTHGAVFEVLQSLWKGHEKKTSKRHERKQSKVKTKATAQLTSTDDADKNNADARPIPENGCDNDEPPSPSPLAYPPRICMHSYSGPPDALSQFLAPTVPADIYFSFSAVINFSSPPSSPATTKAEAVIREIPDHRILIESDLHCAGQRMDSLLKEVIIKVCQLKGWELEYGTRQLKKNWLSFIFGDEHPANS